MKTNATKAAQAASEAADAASRALDAASKAADEEEEERDLGPLFTLDGQKSQRHELTHVYRLEPIDEGHIGDLPKDSTETDIRRRWGGGRFKAQAVDGANQYVASRTMTISGEPLFDNDLARKRYAKWMRDNFGETAPTAPGADPVALEDARQQREAARIKLETDREIAKARALEEARDAAEERRRKREREERRAEAEEREAREEQRRIRERADREEERQRDREQREREQRERMEYDRQQREADREERRLEREARQDPMTQFAAMAQVFSSISGAGANAYPDPVTAAMARLPETIEAATNAAAAAGALGGGGDGEEAEEGGASAKYNPKSDVLLEGELARRAKRAIQNLRLQGKTNDEIATIMAGNFDMLARAKRLEAAAGKPGKKQPAKASYAPPKKKSAAPSRKTAPKK